MSKEEMDKRVALNKKIIKFAVIPAVAFLVLVLIIPKEQTNTEEATAISVTQETATPNPKNLTDEQFSAIVGQDMMEEEKWNTFGEGVNAQHPSTRYWINYIESSNLSMVVDNFTNKVVFAGLGKDSATEYIDNTSKQRTELIEKQFSSWDGSHTEVTKAIKKSMNDSDSYEHINTQYWDRGDHLVVQTEFSGKNGFGGRVKNTVKAKVQVETGSIIEIMQE